MPPRPGVNANEAAILSSAEGLVILGGILALPLSVLPRWRWVVPSLLLIPLAGLAYGVVGMVTMAPADRAATSALIPFFTMLWPTMGMGVVAVPAVVLRYVAQLLALRNSPEG